MVFNVHAMSWLDVYLNIDSSLYKREENGLIISKENYDELSSHQQMILQASYRCPVTESEWFAVRKERITFYIRHIEFMGIYQKGENGFFRMYRIITEEGNVCIWSMWNKPPLNIEDINNSIYTCTGTVDDFNRQHLGYGVYEKQTRLKMCKIKKIA